LIEAQGAQWSSDSSFSSCQLTLIILILIARRKALRFQMQAYFIAMLELCYDLLLP